MEALDDVGGHGPRLGVALAEPAVGGGRARVSGHGPPRGHERRRRDAGRTTPFLLLGAPWVKPEAIIPSLPAAGLTLETATFTPAASPAAPEPKYAGQPCAGIRIAVKDAAAVMPYKFGVGLLVALKGQAGFEWLRDGAALDRLVGTRKLRAAIDRGDPVEAIVASDLPAIEAFRKARQKALLY